MILLDCHKRATDLEMSSPGNNDPSFELTVSTPIIVVGMNRSGTKWLSNILANHPDVACVRGERFQGILETNMFGTMGRKFNLQYPDDYVAFLELWTKSDFFTMTGIDQEWFVALLCHRNWPRDTVEIFALLLQALAHQQRKRFWLQKTGPAMGLALGDRFPSAKVLIIQRDMKDTVRSTVQLATNQGRHVSTARAVYGYVIEAKMLMKLRQLRDVCFLRYEELLAKTEEQVQVVCDHIGIDYSTSLLDISFKRNTSFQHAKRTRPSHWSEWSESLFAAASYAMPLAVAQSISRLRQAITSRPHGSDDRFVFDTFATLKDRWNLD